MAQEREQAAERAQERARRAQERRERKERERAERAAKARPARDRRIRTSALTSPRNVLVLAVALLTVLGVIMVYSATSVSIAESIDKVAASGGTTSATTYQELTSQLLYVGIGLVLAFALVHFSYRFWLGRFIWVLIAITLAMLVAVLVGGSDQGFGATRWIYIGPFSLQPSEFAKITIILVFARLMDQREAGVITFRRFAASLAVLVGGMLLLILVQKDLGTLIIIGAALVTMLILDEVPARIIVGIVAVAAAAVVVLIALQSYRSSRFATWLTDPWRDTEWYYNSGWQSAHGLMAFSSGGFFGVGLGNSRQKYSYLPMSGSDFVFAVIGEELGFLGCMFVILLFCALGWAGFRIARDARDTAGKLLAAGLTSCILVQALINMAGVLRLLPLTGRPLPFISSGGSAMLSAYMMVGLLISVANVTATDEARLPERARRRVRPRAGASAPTLRVIEGGAGASASARPEAEARTPRTPRTSGGRRVRETAGPDEQADGRGEGRPRSAAEPEERDAGAPARGRARTRRRPEGRDERGDVR